MNNIIIQIIVLGAILLVYNYRKQIHRYLDRLMNNDDREGIFQEPCALENAFDELNIEYKKMLTTKATSSICSNTKRGNSI